MGEVQEAHHKPLIALGGIATENLRQNRNFYEAGQLP